MPSSRFPARTAGAACLFLLLFVLSSPAFPQSAASTAQADLDQLVQGAHDIVRGQVVSVTLEPHPQFPNLQTAVITLAVTKVIKGSAGSTLTFRQLHWDASDDTAFASSKRAGEVLLFLNPVSQYGLTSPVGLEQGRFRVLRDAKGNRYVMNGRGNVGLFHQVPSKAGARGIVFSKQAREMLSNPRGQAPLETFEETVRALAGPPR